MESVLRFDGVTKVFRSSIVGRHLYTLGPVSLDVRQGEIFGYLGPNGAGKTTTIKLAMGLLTPSGGRVLCFGEPSSSLRSRSRIGFLPEQPYFYQHLTAFELLEFYGVMSGLDRSRIGLRVESLLGITGLLDHRNTPISKFSKGMLQRIGLAQALINEPDIVILDEPLSGLDPVGRREIRDLIIQLKLQGRTIFLSSHILQDVEMICDRVAILSEGRIREVAAVADVLDGSIKSTELLVESLPIAKAHELTLGRVSTRGNKTVITLPGDSDVNQAVSRIIASGAKILAITPLQQTLEDHFMTRIRSPEQQDTAPVASRAKALQMVAG